MALSDPLSSILYLYHFTDASNLQTIREMGSLFSSAMLRRRGIKDFRPGGNQWSLNADAKSGMDRYVHLCFIDRHPMVHVAKQEGRLERVVYLRVDPGVLRLDGVRYSAGVSNKTGIEVCDMRDAKIDLEVLYERMNWSDPGVYARRRAAEKCEILVPDHVPMKYLEKYFPHG
jgi:hypothetical protein